MLAADTWSKPQQHRLKAADVKIDKAVMFECAHTHIALHDISCSVIVCLISWCIIQTVFRNRCFYSGIISTLDVSSLLWHDKTWSLPFINQSCVQWKRLLQHANSWRKPNLFLTCLHIYSSIGNKHFIKKEKKQVWIDYHCMHFVCL